MTHTESDGFREYVRQKATNGFGRVITNVGRTELALQAMLFDMPLAENPGALTLAELRANPRQAERFQVRRGAGKTVDQGQIGLTARRPLRAGAEGRDGGGEITASVYGGWRDLANPLTFAIIDLERTLYGASLRGTLPLPLGGVASRLSAGVDVQRQDDDRSEFETCIDTVRVPVSARCPTGGAARGALRRDQLERVSSVGPFVRAEVEVARRYWLSVGARADFVNFDVRDRLVSATNPDESGERTLRAVSPLVGAVARLTPLTAVYANVSSAFETPTATELGNQPDGRAGINRELQPQYATTYELGAKGFLFSHLQYDVAGFVTRVEDELIPFEIPGGAGRRFFRNAGRTERRGAEVGLSALVGPVQLGATYSYSHFRFDDYASGGVRFDGKQIPGIPVQQLQMNATVRARNVFATVEGITAGSVFVDDANTARAAGYEVINVRLGGTAAFGRPWLSPMVGVNNVFDRHYVASVSVNAAGGRFYEPAPGRAFFAGLTVAVGR